MIKKASEYIKSKWKNYLFRKKEQDPFERYGGFVFAVLMIAVTFLCPENFRKEIPKYIDVAAIIFVSILYRRIKKARKDLIKKNEEIQLQKMVIEEKQKEIIDSINYAKRIQQSLLPTEKYLERVLKQLRGKG